jgi:hypothetical protein
MCPNWILPSKFSPTERAVYVALLSHDWPDEKGRCKGWVNPGINRIAGLSGASPSSVKTALRVLAGVGVVIIKPQFGGSNKYLLPSLDECQIERLLSLSRAEIQKSGRSTRDSQNLTTPSQNLTDPSRNLTGGWLKSGPEVIQREIDEENKTNEKDEETPPMPPASVDRPSAREETSPAYGRSQEGGEEIVEEEKRSAAAVSPPKNGDGSSDDFSSLRRKLLSAKRETS